MAVFSLHTWRPREGRLPDLIASIAEAKGIIEKHGAAVAAWQPLAGGVAGTILVAIVHADIVAYAQVTEALNKDPDFQAFWARVGADPSATLLESVLASDLDPAEALPEPGSTVLFTTTFQTLRGKALAHRAAAAEARGHLERLGAKVRQLEAIGGPPNSIVNVLGFEDMGHYAEFSSKLAVDEGFANFMLGLQDDPPAEQLDTALAIQLPI